MTNAAQGGRLLLRGQLPGWDPERLSIQEQPRTKQVYWIGVGGDAMPPEFTGYHPGVIIRGCRTLDIPTETVSFVPLTTKARHVDWETGKIPLHVHRLSANPNPENPSPVWAVCDHILTVKLTRLERWKIKKQPLVIPKVSQEDFAAIVEAIRHGYGVIGSHIKEIVAQEREAYKAELDAIHEARMAKLEAISGSPHQP